MFNLLKDIYRRRELLLILVSRNLKIRYKNSALGFFWTLLVPIFLIVIYSIFLGLLKVSIPLPVLVTGIIVWQFLAMCLGDSLQTITGSALLVKKTAFPRIVLPLAMVAANLVNFLLTFIVLITYLIIARVTIGAVYCLPFIILTHLALCLGMALILSSINVFFRDTEHILSVVMLAWFFLTPIIYTIDFLFERIPGSLKHLTFLAFLNPMTGIVTSYRTVLVSTTAPGISLTAVSFLVAWIVLIAGVVIFQKCEAKFADEL